MKQLLIFSILFTFSFSSFIKSENIVIDKKQNLMWQDNIEVTHEENIILGNIYCEELILNGYIDWKLPTIKQLQSLLDQEGKENLLNKTFKFFTIKEYWSNTPNAMDTTKYWYLDFKTGKVANKDKESLGYIRCVRQIQ